MTSLHRLLAICAVWIGFAIAATALLSTAFINHLSSGTMLTICTIFALAAVMSTGYIVRAAPVNDHR
jgi:uncharacterized membrane protein